MNNYVTKKIVSFILVIALILMGPIPDSEVLKADSLVTDFSYDFAYTTAGYACGTIRINANEDGVYKTFWGDENGKKLSKNGHEYTYFARVVVQNNEGSFNITNKQTAIPSGAKKVLVYKKTEKVYEYNLPESKIFNEAEGYSLGSLSDPHYGRYNAFNNEYNDDSVLSVNAAMDFFHSDGIKFVGVAGDLTAGGEQSSLDKYNAAASRYSDMTVLTCIGNHDSRTTVSTSDKKALVTSATRFYDSILGKYYTVDADGEVHNNLPYPILANDALTNPIQTQYREEAGGEVLTKNLPGFDFVTEAGGNIFIFFNEIAKTGETYDTDKLITTGQLDWLQQQLETYKDRNVFIYFHSFLCVNTDKNDAVDYNNCVGDLKNAGGYSYDLDFKDVVKTSDGLNLQALLSKYSNAAMFTGHSHWQYAAQDINSCLNIGRLKDGAGATLLHVSSCGAPRYIGENDTARTELNGYSSEGTVVTTYDDCTIYTGAEFLKKEYEAYATYIVPTKGSTKYAPVKNENYKKSTTSITGTQYLELEDLTDLQVAGSSYNLTLGAGYKYTSKSDENKDGTLTDGKISGGEYASKAGKDTPQEVYITLDGEQEVSNINKFLIHFSSGVSNADTLRIELSNDGENYQSAGYYTNHKFTETSLVPDLSKVTIDKFKYVKLVLISGGKTYGYHIKEFAVIGNERNLIPNTANSESSLIDGIIDEEDFIATDYNMVYCADYEQSSTGNENKVGALTDGSLNGYMNTERSSSATNQNIIIDLGIGTQYDVSNIDYFLLYSQNDATYVSAFDVSVSLDGENYESVGKYNNASMSVTHFDADLSKVTLNKFRFIKLHLTAGKTNYGYQVKEFAVIGKNPITIEKPEDQSSNVGNASINYALNKNLYVTSTYAKEGSDYKVLNDGNLNKYWSSDWDKSRTFEDVVIDLGSNVDADTIGSILVNFKSNNTFCKDVSIYVSKTFDENDLDDGFTLIGKKKTATWDALQKISDSNGYAVYSIPQCTNLGDVRYVKIHMNGHSDYGFQVKEVAVIKCAKKRTEGETPTTQEVTTVEETTEEITTEEITTEVISTEPITTEAITTEEITTEEVTTTSEATTKSEEPTTKSEEPTTEDVTTVQTTTKSEVTTTSQETTKPEVTTVSQNTTAVKPTTQNRIVTTKNTVVIPKKVKLNSAKSKKKKTVKLSWKKLSNVSGYQIKYSVKKSFKKPKYKTVKKNIAKATIKKLKRRKVYYFIVRAYILNNGKRIFGPWSSKKKAKIK